MLLLALLVAVEFGVLAYLENPNRGTNYQIKQMIREARYHEAHPETKRSVKYMNAGYFN